MLPLSKSKKTLPLMAIITANQFYCFTMATIGAISDDLESP